MRPILICGFLFVYTYLVNATPHGYGAKSGAGAVANAGATAGASGDLNASVSLPAGGSYSGSFSKSSSSSSAASSASSSALSFFGSGFNGNSAKCISNCENKEQSSGSAHRSNDYNNRQNIAASGNINPVDQDSTNLFNGTKAAGAAQADAIGINNMPPCTGNNCPKKECKDANCNVATSTKCIADECNLSSQEQVTIKTEPDTQCASGLCGSTLKTETKPYEPNKYVNDNSNINCASGQCFGVSPQNPSASSVPKCTGNECASFPNNLNPNQGFSVPPSEPTATYHSSFQKCTAGQCATSKYEETAPVSVNSEIYVNTGKSNHQKSYDTNIYGDLQVDEKLLKLNEPSSDCTGGGNCVPIKPIISVVNSNPTLNGPAEISKCKYPNNCNDIYNHTISPSSGSVISLPVDMKPANFLTTPKQGPSCTSSNCETKITLPESTTTSNIGFDSNYQSNNAVDNKTPNCVGGSCSSGYPNANVSPSNSRTPNHPTVPETNCSASICASPSQNPANKPALSQPIYSIGIPIIKPIVSSVIFSSHTRTSVTKPQQTAPHSYHSPVSYPAVETDTHPQSDIPKEHLNHQTTLSPIRSLPSNNPFLTSSSLNNKSPNGNTFPAFIPLKPTDSTSCGGTECSVNKYPNQNNEPLKPSYINPGLTPVSNTSTFTSGGASIGLQTEINSNAKKLHNSHDAHYTGGFGGPPGFLKPNDFNGQVSNTKPASNNPTASCAFGVCDNNENKKDLINSKPPAAHNPSSCSNGNCDSHNSNPQIVHNKPSSTNGVNAAAIAAATASAGVYAGGFGGPPGFLKPQTTNSDVKHPSSTQFGTAPKNPLTAVSPSLQKETSAVGTGAQAFAAAGASAGASAGGSYPSSSYDKLGKDEHKTHNGCDGGCAANGNIGGLNLGYSGNIGQADKAQAGAQARAVSGANAGAFGLERSFASSSATAHASAGTAIKGYGRR